MKKPAVLQSKWASASTERALKARTVPVIAAGLARLALRRARSAGSAVRGVGQRSEATCTRRVRRREKRNRWANRAVIPHQHRSACTESWWSRQKNRSPDRTACRTTCPFLPGGSLRRETNPNEMRSRNQRVGRTSTRAPSGQEAQKEDPKPAAKVATSQGEQSLVLSTSSSVKRPGALMMNTKQSANHTISLCSRQPSPLAARGLARRVLVLACSRVCTTKQPIEEGTSGSGPDRSGRACT